MQRTRLATAASVGLSLGLLVAAATAAGAGRNATVPAAGPYTTVVPASVFLPVSNASTGTSVEYRSNAQGFVFKVGGSINLVDFIGPVSLPDGARLEAVTLEACDDHPDGAVFLALHRCDVGSDGLCTPLGETFTTTAGTPGCGLLTIAPLSETIDNSSFRYNFILFDSHDGPETKFRSVALRWTAPALAFYPAE